MNTQKSLEVQFADFAKALKAAKQGDCSLLEISDSPTDCNIKKVAILKLDGFVVYTLTKTASLDDSWCEFRVWVRKGWFCLDGGHVDEYDHGCIFAACGNFNELKSLAKQYLTENLYMFEDKLYVVWL